MENKGDKIVNNPMAMRDEAIITEIRITDKIGWLFTLLKILLNDFCI